MNTVDLPNIENEGIVPHRNDKRGIFPIFKFIIIQLSTAGSKIATLKDKKKSEKF